MCIDKFQSIEPDQKVLITLLHTNRACKVIRFSKLI